jgi:hypothetical protein
VGHIERTIEISAPAEKIFDVLVELDRLYPPGIARVEVKLPRSHLCHLAMAAPPIPGARDPSQSGHGDILRASSMGLRG